MESFFFYAIVGISVTLVLSSLSRKAGQRVPEKDNGNTFLRMNKLYGVVGWGGIGISVTAIIFFFFFIRPFDMGNVVALHIISGIFLGTGIPSLLYFKNYTLIFDDQKIEVSDWLGRIGIVQWENITSVKFRTLSGVIEIRSSDNSHLKVHQHLVGLRSFLDKMEEKTIWSAEKIKFH